MARRQKKDKDLLKWKKKKWYAIYAPKLFSEAFIGESLVMQPEELNKKTVEVSLMNLTGEIKRQHIYIKFKVTKVVENRAYTEPVAYKMTAASIKRLVRRRKDRIDDSFNLVTRDSKVIKIKPLFITRSNTYNSVITTIRKTARGFLTGYISRNDYDIVFKAIVSGRLQQELYRRLKRIYPLRIVEIRAFGIETNKKKADKLLKQIAAIRNRRNNAAVSKKAQKPAEKAAKQEKA